MFQSFFFASAAIGNDNLDHSKSTSLTKWNFLNPLSSLPHYLVFSQTPFPCDIH